MKTPWYSKLRGIFHPYWMTNYLPNYTAVICFHVTTVYQLNNANYYRIMISKTKVSKLQEYCNWIYLAFIDCKCVSCTKILNERFFSIFIVFHWGEKSPPSLESNSRLEWTWYDVIKVARIAFKKSYLICNSYLSYQYFIKTFGAKIGIFALCCLSFVL